MMWGVATTEHCLPLSPKEATAFGWDHPGRLTPIVLTTRSPLGRRLIPTRELIEGAFVYGFVETYEREVRVDLEPWELGLTDEDDPQVGLLM